MFFYFYFVNHRPRIETFGTMPCRNVGNGFCKDLHKTHLVAVYRDGDHLKLGSVHGLVGRIVGDGGGDGVAEGFAIGGHPHFDLGGSEDPSVGYVGETKHYIAEADAFAEFDVGLKVVSGEAKPAVREVVDIASLAILECLGSVFVIRCVGFVGEGAGDHIVERELLRCHKGGRLAFFESPGSDDNTVLNGEGFGVEG